MDTHGSLIMFSRWKWAANPCNTTHRSSSCRGVGVTSYLEMREEEERQERWGCASCRRLLSAPPQPWRVTPWSFYHCLLSSKFDQYFFTQSDCFPLDATDAKGANLVYTVRVIKHGWTGCNLSQKKTNKKQAPTANPQHQLPRVGNMESLSFCLYMCF